MLTPLLLPQKDHHMSHITLALPLAREASGAATSSEGLGAPCVCAHCPCEVRPWSSEVDAQPQRGGELILAHFLLRKASGWMTLTTVRSRED